MTSIKLGNKTFSVPYADLVRPLTEAEYAALRERAVRLMSAHRLLKPNGKGRWLP